MGDLCDSPFQMDEDLQLPLPRAVDQKQVPTRQHPRDFSGGLASGAAPSQAHLKSALARLQMATDSSSAGANANSTTEVDTLDPGALEEPEPFYEEDLDDKFDGQVRTTAVNCSLADGKGEPLSPPENFAPVINKIYRSLFPQPPNFSFLKKLKLKSVLCLIPEDYPEVHLDFFQQEGITLYQMGMSGNKEPFVEISAELITAALRILLDPAKHPILIHCNRGKHRTGCLVGVLRRLQGWSHTIIFDEYRMFAAPKERPMDQQFIELYDKRAIEEYVTGNGFLPMQWD